MSADGPAITVVLADDHAVVRSGLRLLLECAGDLEVVSEAGSAEDAVRTAPRRSSPPASSARSRMPTTPNPPPVVEDAERRGARAGQLTRGLEHAVEHDVDIELGQQAPPR
jgi:DNA-binding NarL/FixJ family response regulator